MSANSVCDVIDGEYVTSSFRERNLQADVLGKELTQLKSLRLPGCGLTDFDLLGLRPLTRLTLLDICDSQEVRLHTSLLRRWYGMPHGILCSAFNCSTAIVFLLDIVIHGLDTEANSLHQVTVDGFSALLPLKNLKELSLEGCTSVNDGAVS